MSAMTQMRAAVLAALRADPLLRTDVNGVYDAVPPGAQPPFIVLPDGASIDWGTKTARGRELRLPVTIEVDRADPSPLARIADAGEAAVLALPADLPGWRIASCVYLRSLTSADGKRHRRLIEFRIRMLEI